VQKHKKIAFEELQALAEGGLVEPRKSEVEAALERDPILKETYLGIVEFLENESVSIGKFVEDAENKILNVEFSKLNVEGLISNDALSISKDGDSVYSGEKKWYWLVGVAAVFLLGFFFFKPSSLQPDDFDFTDAGLSVNLSINDQKLSEAMNAYKLEDFPVAQDLLLQELAINPGNDTLNYYLGVIAKEQQNFSTAETYFTQVSPTSYFYQKAEYQLGLIYWYLGEDEKARRQFEGISKNQHHLFFGKAKKISSEF